MDWRACGQAYLIFNTHDRRNKNWIRIVALAVIVCFLNQDIIWAQGGTPAWSKGSGESFSFKAGQAPGSEVNIPRSLATTKDSFSGTSDKTIINIQDAHSSIGAQDSIVSILDSLVANYDLKLIAIEGSSGYIDTSLLKTFPDQKVRNSIADRLVKEGRMSAGEFFTITRDDKEIALYGIEDKPLYQKNVEEFVKMQELNKLVTDDLANLSQALETIKDKVYSDELKKLDTNAKLHNEGKIAFSQRWEYTLSLAKRFNLEHSKYQNLSKLATSLIIEKTIDFGKANTQRDQLIDELSKKLPKDRLEDLVLKTLSFKTNKISQGQFYTYLKTLAQTHNIEPIPYADFIAFTDYITLYESIDLFEIFVELKGFESEVEEKLFRGEDEKVLGELSTQLAFLKSLFTLNITAEDYEKLQELNKKYDAAYIAAFIRDTNVKYNLPIPTGFDVGAIYERIPQALQFYKTAEARNSTMIFNTVQRMQAEGKRVAALVTGGYHSTGMADILKKNQTSYVVILPKFDPDKGERPYVAILTRQKAQYDELLKSGTHYLATAALFETDPTRTPAEQLLDYKADIIGWVREAIKGIRDERLAYERTKALADEWYARYEDFYKGFMAPGRSTVTGFTPRTPESIRRFLDEDVVKSIFPEAPAPAVVPGVEKLMERLGIVERELIIQRLLADQQLTADFANFDERLDVVCRRLNVSSQSVDKEAIKIELARAFSEKAPAVPAVQTPAAAGETKAPAAPEKPAVQDAGHEDISSDLLSTEMIIRLDEELIGKALTGREVSIKAIQDEILREAKWFLREEEKIPPILIVDSRLPNGIPRFKFKLVSDPSDRTNIKYLLADASCFDEQGLVRKGAISYELVHEALHLWFRKEFQKRILPASYDDRSERVAEEVFVRIMTKLIIEVNKARALGLERPAQGVNVKKMIEEQLTYLTSDEVKRERPDLVRYQDLLLTDNGALQEVVRQWCFTAYEYTLHKTLAATAAHVINNKIGLLGSINGTLEMINRLTPKDQQYIDEMEQAAQRGKRLIQYLREGRAGLVVRGFLEMPRSGTSADLGDGVTATLPDYKEGDLRLYALDEEAMNEVVNKWTDIFNSIDKTLDNILRVVDEMRGLYTELLNGQIQISTLLEERRRLSASIQRYMDIINGYTGKTGVISLVSQRYLDIGELDVAVRSGKIDVDYISRTVWPRIPGFRLPEKPKQAGPPGLFNKFLIFLVMMFLPWAAALGQETLIPARQINVAKIEMPVKAKVSTSAAIDQRIRQEIELSAETVRLIYPNIGDEEFKARAASYFFTKWHETGGFRWSRQVGGPAIGPGVEPETAADIVRYVKKLNAEDQRYFVYFLDKALNGSWAEIAQLSGSKLGERLSSEIMRNPLFAEALLAVRYMYGVRSALPEFSPKFEEKTGAVVTASLDEQARHWQENYQRSRDAETVKDRVSSFKSTISRLPRWAFDILTSLRARPQEVALQPAAAAPAAQISPAVQPKAAAVTPGAKEVQTAGGWWFFTKMLAYLAAIFTFINTVLDLLRWRRSIARFVNKGKPGDEFDMTAKKNILRDEELISILLQCKKEILIGRIPGTLHYKFRIMEGEGGSRLMTGPYEYDGHTHPPFGPERELYHFPSDLDLLASRGKLSYILSEKGITWFKADESVMDAYFRGESREANLEEHIALLRSLADKPFAEVKEALENKFSDRDSGKPYLEIDFEPLQLKGLPSLARPELPVSPIAPPAAGPVAHFQAFIDPAKAAEYYSKDRFVVAGQQPYMKDETGIAAVQKYFREPEKNRLSRLPITVPGVGERVLEIDVQLRDICARYGIDIRKLLQEEIMEAIKIRGPDGYKDVPDKPIIIALLDRSESIFEDHISNGFIGINKVLFDRFDRMIAETARLNNVALSADDKTNILSSLLTIGITHELRHESDTKGVLGEGTLCIEDVRLALALALQKKIDPAYLCSSLRLIIDTKRALFINRMIETLLIRHLTYIAELKGIDRSILPPEEFTKQFLNSIPKGLFGGDEIATDIGYLTHTIGLAYEQTAKCIRKEGPVFVDIYRSAGHDADEIMITYPGEQQGGLDVASSVLHQRHIDQKDSFFMTMKFEHDGEPLKVTTNFIVGIFNEAALAKDIGSAMQRQLEKPKPAEPPEFVFTEEEPAMSQQSDEWRTMKQELVDHLRSKYGEKEVVPYSQFATAFLNKFPRFLGVRDKGYMKYLIETTYGSLINAINNPDEAYIDVHKSRGGQEGRDELLIAYNYRGPMVSAMVSDYIRKADITIYSGTSLVFEGQAHGKDVKIVVELLQLVTPSGMRSAPGSLDNPGLKKFVDEQLRPEFKRRLTEPVFMSKQQRSIIGLVDEAVDSEVKDLLVEFKVKDAGYALIEKARNIFFTSALVLEPTYDIYLTINEEIEDNQLAELHPALRNQKGAVIKSLQAKMIQIVNDAMRRLAGDGIKASVAINKKDDLDRPVRIRVSVEVNMVNLSRLWMGLGTGDFKMDAGRLRPYTKEETLRKMNERVKMCLAGLELKIEESIDKGDEILENRLREEFAGLKVYFYGDGTDANPGLINIILYPDKEARITDEDYESHFVKMERANLCRIGPGGEKFVRYGNLQFIKVESYGGERAFNKCSYNDLIALGNDNPYFSHFIGKQSADRYMFLARAAGSVYQTFMMERLMKGHLDDRAYMFFISRDTIGERAIRYLHQIMVLRTDFASTKGGEWDNAPKPLESFDQLAATMSGPYGYYDENYSERKIVEKDEETGEIKSERIEKVEQEIRITNNATGEESVAGIFRNRDLTMRWQKDGTEKFMAPVLDPVTRNETGTITVYVNNHHVDKVEFSGEIALRTDPKKVSVQGIYYSDSLTIAAMLNAIFEQCELTGVLDMPAGQDTLCIVDEIADGTYPLILKYIIEKKTADSPRPIKVKIYIGKVRSELFAKLAGYPVLRPSDIAGAFDDVSPLQAEKITESISRIADYVPHGFMVSVQKEGGYPITNPELPIKFESSDIVIGSYLKSVLLYNGAVSFIQRYSEPAGPVEEVKPAQPISVFGQLVAGAALGLGTLLYAHFMQDQTWLVAGISLGLLATALYTFMGLAMRILPYLAARGITRAGPVIPFLASGIDDPSVNFAEVRNGVLRTNKANLATLPKFIQHYIALHEKTHLLGAGELPATLFPVLGVLYKDRSVLLKHAAEAMPRSSIARIVFSLGMLLAAPVIGAEAEKAVAQGTAESIFDVLGLAFVAVIAIGIVALVVQRVINAIRSTREKETPQSDLAIITLLLKNLPDNVWGGDNKAVNRAALVIQEELKRGNNVEVVYEEGSPVKTFSEKNLAFNAARPNGRTTRINLYDLAIKAGTIPVLFDVKIPWAAYEGEARGEDKAQCPVCGATGTAKRRIIINGREYTILNCEHDGWSWMSPTLPQGFIKKLYSDERYFRAEDVPEIQRSVGPGFERFPILGYRNYNSPRRKADNAIRSKVRVGDIERVVRDDLKMDLGKKGRVRLLEVGCANGDNLAHPVDLGWDAYGIDISEKAINDGKKNHPSYAGRLIAGTFPSEKLPLQEWDIITAYNLVEHLSNIPKFIEDVRNKLTSGGMLVADVPILPLMYPRKYRSYVEHLHHPTIPGMIRLLNDSGFRVINIYCEKFDDGWNLTNIVVFAQKEEKPVKQGSATVVFPSKTDLEKYTQLFGDPKTQNIEAKIVPSLGRPMMEALPPLPSPAPTRPVPIGAGVIPTPKPTTPAPSAPSGAKAPQARDLREMSREELLQGIGPYIVDHERRVAGIASLIARKLGLDKGIIDELQHIAWAHDRGGRAKADYPEVHNALLEVEYKLPPETKPMSDVAITIAHAEKRANSGLRGPITAEERRNPFLLYREEMRLLKGSDFTAEEEQMLKSWWDHASLSIEELHGMGVMISPEDEVVIRSHEKASLIDTDEEIRALVARSSKGPEEIRLMLAIIRASDIFENGNNKVRRQARNKPVEDFSATFKILNSVFNDKSISAHKSVLTALAALIGERDPELLDIIARARQTAELSPEDQVFIENVQPRGTPWGKSMSIDEARAIVESPDFGQSTSGAIVFKMGLPEPTRNAIIYRLQEMRMDTCRFARLDGPVPMDIVVQLWSEGFEKSLSSLESLGVNISVGRDLLERGKLDARVADQFLEWATSVKKFAKERPKIFCRDPQNLNKAYEALNILIYSLRALRGSAEIVILRSRLPRSEIVRIYGDKPFQQILKEEIVGKTNVRWAQASSLRGGIIRGVIEMEDRSWPAIALAKELDIPNDVVYFIANGIHCATFDAVAKEKQLYLSAATLGRAPPHAFEATSARVWAMRTGLIAALFAAAGFMFEQFIQDSVTSNIIFYAGLTLGFYFGLSALQFFAVKRSVEKVLYGSLTSRGFDEDEARLLSRNLSIAHSTINYAASAKTIENSYMRLKADYILPNYIVRDRLLLREKINREEYLKALRGAAYEAYTRLDPRTRKLLLIHESFSHFWGMTAMMPIRSIFVRVPGAGTGKAYGMADILQIILLTSVILPALLGVISSISERTPVRPTPISALLEPEKAKDPTDLAIQEALKSLKDENHPLAKYALDMTSSGIVRFSGRMDNSRRAHAAFECEINDDGKGNQVVENRKFVINTDYLVPLVARIRALEAAKLYEEARIYRTLLSAIIVKETVHYRDSLEDPYSAMAKFNLMKEFSQAESSILARIGGSIENFERLDKFEKEPLIELARRVSAVQIATEADGYIEFWRYLLNHGITADKFKLFVNQELSSLDLAAEIKLFISHIGSTYSKVLNEAQTGFDDRLVKIYLMEVAAPQPPMSLRDIPLIPFARAMWWACFFEVMENRAVVGERGIEPSRLLPVEGYKGLQPAKDFMNFLMNEEYLRLPARKAAPKPRVGKVPEFIFGVPKDASRKLVVELGKRGKVVRASDEADFRTKLASMGEITVPAVFIDQTMTLNYIRDPKFAQTIDAVRDSRFFQKYQALLTLNEASIRTKTRDELLTILAIILPHLPKIAAGNIDMDVQMALGETGVGTVEELKEGIAHMVAQRREEVRKAYNAMPMPLVGEVDRNKVVIATTETIAKNDPFFADNMQQAEAQGVTPCFIFGDILKSTEEAKAYIRAAGYKGDVEHVIFINKNDYPNYDAMVRAIQEKAKVLGREVPLEKIGIRSADEEVYKEERDGKTPLIGKILAVQPFVQPNGEKIYVSINTYQAILGLVEGMALDSIGLPGLSQDAKGVFKYLPRSMPIDYDKEIGAYQSAMEVLRIAA